MAPPINSSSSSSTSQRNSTNTNTGNNSNSSSGKSAASIISRRRGLSSAYSSVNLTTAGQDDSSSEEAHSIPAAANGKPVVPPRPRSISASRNGVLLATNGASNVGSIIHSFNNNTGQNNGNVVALGRGGTPIKSMAVNDVAATAAAHSAPAGGGSVDVDNADCELKSENLSKNLNSNVKFPPSSFTPKTVTAQLCSNIISQLMQTTNSVMQLHQRLTSDADPATSATTASALPPNGRQKHQMLKELESAVHMTQAMLKQVTQGQQR